MKQNIEKLIIKSLIKTQKPYLTAQELADIIHVSRRTIFNNLSKVKEICEKSGCFLISVKSKGYRIEGVEKIHANLNLEKVDRIKPFNKEYILYILYLLLSEEDEIHISELSEILFLSRPTVYKILDDIAKWFARYDLKLEVSRKGIKVENGEKRRRDAIKDWLNETEKFLNVNGSLNVLKLNKCFSDFMIIEDELALDLVKRVSDSNKLFLSQYELNNMAYLLEAMLYQICSHKYVTVRKRTLDLCLEFFTEEKFNYAIYLVETATNISVSENEMAFFLISLLNNSYIEDRSLKRRMQETEIDKELIAKMLDYLRIHLNIDDVDYMELINEIEYIIKREILFKIKADRGESSEHYRTILKKYQSSVIMAQELFEIISEFYSIEYDEKTICNIAFTIMSITHKNKKNVKTILFHNCDIFEFNFVFLSLNNFPYISLLFSTDNIDELESYLRMNDIDLIITTTDLENKTIPILKISKVFGGKEIIENFKYINQIYQNVNFRRIIKGIDLNRKK